MAAADDLLAHAQRHADDLATPGMSPRPQARVAVLTCMDTRIDPAQLLGVERGDAHTIRNAGGLVTDDALRSLSVSQRLLGTTEIVVVMHAGCGLHGASEDDFARQLSSDGVLPGWRLGGFEDLEHTLRASVRRLRGAPELVHHDAIRGFVFDPEDGSLREIDA